MHSHAPPMTYLKSGNIGGELIIIINISETHIFRLPEAMGVRVGY